MAKYKDVKAAILGKAFDIDGYYGAQCWDGVFYVAEKYLNGKRCHCGISGYVKDVAAQRSTNGILNWCKDIGLNEEMKPGDICIWTNCTACPYSHIAFYDHDNGQNAVYFLGQNQGGYGFTVQQIPVNGIIAIFRPNAWDDSTATTAATKVTWDNDAVLSVGDIVKSKSCGIAVYGNTYSAIKDDKVNIPDLGGLIPLEDVHEASNTGDGKCDDYLSNLKAKVYLIQCKVVGVDAKKNMVKIKGAHSGKEYWVKPDKLCKKV